MSRVVAIVLAVLVPVSVLVTLPARLAFTDPGVVSTAGTRLIKPDGRPFFIVGVNYVGAPDRSWTMWQDGLFDAGVVERDFDRAKAAGANTVRVFVRPPLQQEITSGQWGKLDAVVDLAERLGLYLIVTLYDYREDDLSKVAAIGRAIASRYAGRDAILAYDLKNEPHYSNLAISQYPGSPAPLQTDALIRHYGQQMTQQQADAWRQTEEGRSLIPARFSSHQAYIYANNYRIYKQFVDEVGEWVAARSYEVSSLDYLASADSSKWRPLVSVLDQTLAAWLRPQVEAIRAGDSRRLITVGYSDAILAGLSANQSLDFVSIHRFPGRGLKPLRVVFDLLDDVQRTFPAKPLVLEEFGYCNSNVEESVSAQHETALMLYLLGKGMAGGVKWSLYDVTEGWDACQMSYGVYRNDGGAKPLVSALGAVGGYAAASPIPSGKLTIDAQPDGPGLTYIYTAPDALFAAAQSYADSSGRLGFTGSTIAQVFLSWSNGDEVCITTSAPITLRLNLSKLIGVGALKNVALHRADGSAVAFAHQGETITFSTVAGEQYRLKFNVASVDARIEIVWPHGNLPVSQAELANVGAYLFERDSNTAVCPQLAPNVRLWRSLNNDVEEEVAMGVRRSAYADGLWFNVWDFNNVDVSAARNEANKYYLRLSVDGFRYRSSVWSHGEDARTYMPNPDVPSGVAPSPPDQVDAKIEIVWPHGNLPVDRATKVNVGAYLFVRGTLRSVPADWSPVVRLWRSLNNGYEEEVAIGRKVIKTVGELSIPTWEFNDVDVSAAKDPVNKYYFRVTVDGVDSRSNVWAHGADARTHFPRKDVPTGVAACD